MHYAVRKDPDVSLLERVDRLTTLEAAREEGVDRPRNRLEDGIVVAHGGLAGEARLVSCR
jgi:hypothetical protein